MLPSIPFAKVAPSNPGIKHLGLVFCHQPRIRTLAEALRIHTAGRRVDDCLAELAARVAIA
jgi:hypothetical protein